jgi:hypothetical protein
MNKYEHLEMLEYKNLENADAYYTQMKQMSDLLLHTQKLSSLLQDCLEFVPSDLRGKIENAIRT